MGQRMGLVSLLILVCHLSFGQKEGNVEKYSPVETDHIYHLGNKMITIKSYRYGERKDIVMINLHSDETTSVDAAKKVLEETGGVLLKIENNNERIIHFILSGREFSFDPNRMFTRKGVTASLKKFHNYSSHAAKKIEGFAKFVLHKIPSGNKTLIALHNNDEGNYSIDSYAKGEFSKDVAEVNVENFHDKDNFFFTTDRELHKILVENKFNSALQNNRSAADDGSLSVYYGKKRRSYVNVEAESGKRNEQMKMIRFLVAQREN